jgi:hypothetical protein
MYSIDELSRIKNLFGYFLVAVQTNNQVRDIEAFKIVSKCNQIPFCKNHYKHLCANKINFLDLD